MWCRLCVFGSIFFICLSIDLNFDVVWGGYEGPPLDIDDFLADGDCITIYGFKIKVLSPVKSLIQVALHGYKDMNSMYLLLTRKQLNPRVFDDIYNLIINNRLSVQPHTLSCICERLSISRYIYYMLYYTYQMHSDDILKPYLDSLIRYADPQIMNTFGLRASERQAWPIPFSERITLTNLDEYVKPHLTTHQRRMIEYNKKYLE